MQTLIAVRLRHTQPVTQPLGVRLIHVRDDGIYLPAVHLLLLQRGVENDTDGKEVVNTLEGTFLLLHLLPDRVYRLRASFDMELQPCRFQALTDRLDEMLDIRITTLFRLAELLLDMIIGIMLQVFQRQVLQLTLQLIETQLVGKGGIKISSLLAHLMLCLRLSRITDLTHQVDTVGNHNKDDTHILGKGEQQVTEILRLDDRVLLIKVLDALQPMQDAGDRLTELTLDNINGKIAVLHTGMQQDGKDGITLQPDLLHHQVGGLETQQHRIQAEHITTDMVLLDIIRQILTHLFLITLQE